MNKSNIFDQMNANPIIAAVGRNIARQMFEDSAVDGQAEIVKKIQEWQYAEGGIEHEALKDAVAFCYAALVRGSVVAS
jgi:hypothetical protein